MGPYCKFCDTRCFIHIPAGTPEYILKAYNGSTIVATCRAGQEFEKKHIGYSYADIKKALESADPKPQDELILLNTETKKELDDRAALFGELANVEAKLEALELRYEKRLADLETRLEQAEIEIETHETFKQFFSRALYDHLYGLHQLPHDEPEEIIKPGNSRRVDFREIVFGDV